MDISFYDRKPSSTATAGSFRKRRTKACFVKDRTVLQW